MDNLPSVTAFEIKKDLNNLQDRFDSSNLVLPKKKENVLKKINNIFKSNNHVYKSNVRIIYNNKVLEKVIVGKTSTHLLTIEGEKLPIINIIDIEKI